MTRKIRRKTLGSAPESLLAKAAVGVIGKQRVIRNINIGNDKSKRGLNNRNSKGNGI